MCNVYKYVTEYRNWKSEKNNNAQSNDLIKFV